MRLMIHNYLTSNGSGPGVFSLRLATYLSKHFDVKIVKRKPDVMLCGISMQKIRTPVPKVFRVDGCYSDLTVKNSKTRNKHIERAIDRCQGVVYQSKFSKNMVNSILSIKTTKNRISTLIYNGFDQSIVDSVKPVEKDCEWLFIANAKWRPDKRPESIIEGFLEADIPDSKLIMIGMPQPKVPMLHSCKLVFIPFMKPSKLYPYYKAADALIHLRYLEPCSNSVIEALSFGLPVICNNTGGTPEIVGDDGYIIPCDSYAYKFHYGVQPVPPSMTAAAIHKCVSDGHRKVYRPDLDMSVIAKQYYNFFFKVMEV